MKNILSLVLITLILIGCAGKPYNPDGLSPDELVTVHRTTHYPHNYWLMEVNGFELVRAWETPVAPGTYEIVWMRTTLGEYGDQGRLNVTLKPNREYRIGLLDKDKLKDVSIWDTESGEVVSTQINGN